MVRRLIFAAVSALALLGICSCANPLLDRVRGIVGTKDDAPVFNIKTASGKVSAGGSFDFGTISINTTKDVVFTVENLGNADLLLTDTPKVSISGTDAALFAVNGDYPSSPIAAGSSTTFVLRFLPVTNGSKTATVSVPNNDAARGTFSFTVTGGGSIQPEIQILNNLGVDIPCVSGTYSYGLRAVGSPSSAISFTISNPGSATLNLLGAPFVSIPGAEFVVVSQPAGAAISAGGTTTFTVRYTPSDIGNRSAVVTILSDDSDEGTFTFTLTGVASTVLMAKSGQTTSYTAGDDGDLEAGTAWPGTRFSATGQSMTDNLTGLQWVANGNLLSTNYPGLDTEGTAGDGRVTWATALSFIATLNGASFDGHNDWRLPNRDEIRSLANYEQATVNTWLTSAPQNFANVMSDSYYWTSTTYAGTTANAWRIQMSNCSIAQAAKTTNYHYVWPVRSVGGGTVSLARTGQTTSYASGDDGDLEAGSAWPGTRFVDNADGTITDNLTGLMWEESPSTGTYTWAQASALPSGCTTGGHADWRLPNVNELESLLNAEQSDSVGYLNGLGFVGLANSTYWASTTHAGATAEAWVIQLAQGMASTGNKTGAARNVILVRTIP
jgi:hypothetical protein